MPTLPLSHLRVLELGSGDALDLVGIGHWQASTRPFMGPHLLPSVAYREGGDAKPYAITRLAPTLGQHNTEVLKGLLGLSDDGIAVLRDEGIIG